MDKKFGEWLKKQQMEEGPTCPECGCPLEFDEVDVGVGTIRGNPGCPNCHWVPKLGDE